MDEDDHAECTGATLGYSGKWTGISKSHLSHALLHTPSHMHVSGAGSVKCLFVRVVFPALIFKCG